MKELSGLTRKKMCPSRNSPLLAWLAYINHKYHKERCIWYRTQQKLTLTHIENSSLCNTVLFLEQSQ